MEHVVNVVGPWSSGQNNRYHNVSLLLLREIIAIHDFELPCELTIRISAIHCKIMNFSVKKDSRRIPRNTYRPPP